MKHHRLADMKGGWFMGDFVPCAERNTDAEVGLKRYPAGAREDKHFHKVATELTLVVSGTVRMFDQVWHAGDIITAEPGDATAFEALSDAVTVVVKTPSVPSDKYLP
ncbi:hypothetical protein JHFBIEKO_3116 [Methylobacterium mesophilicum]|uniref:hypothetical protein n=1 Tax=Methylobacterium mesophilicum TaxID=39956 RepID=UPI001EE15DA2|nr:hypothetical protein [Methylobacterium mesophilicum]GJE22660.1 hypothetical protein JHFBIEKO_3116 [Methylobacterium mesophilicum]